MLIDAAGVPRVVVVGSVNVDLVARVSRLPGPGETVQGGDLRREPGGKGANQAVAVARLLGASTLIGSVGDDADGAWMKNSLAALGVDTTDVRTLPSAPTGMALVAVDDRGENQIVVCPGANADVVIPSGALDGASVVLAQLEVDMTVVEAAAAAAGRSVFVLNASPAQDLPPSVLERCDVVVVNETEYERIPALRRASQVVVTRGAAGSELLHRGEVVERVAAAAAEVVSTVGAGDAFCAALAAGVAAGKSLPDATRVASAVAAHAVAEPATQAPLHRLDRYDAVVG